MSVILKSKARFVLLFTIAATSLCAAAHEMTIPCFIRNVTAGSATVCWEWREPSASVFVYGTSPSYGDTVRCPKESENTVRLSNLKPNTGYYYAVIAGDKTFPADPQDYRFFTAPDDIRESFVFAVIGDTRTGEESFNADHAAVIGSIRSHSHPALLLHLGDMVDVTEKGRWENFFSIESPLLSGCALVPVRGTSDGSVEEFTKLFRIEGGNAWYSFRYGPVYFIILDVPNKKPASFYDETIGPKSAQYQWLDKTLASEERRKSPFTVICMFAPLFIDKSDGTGYRAKLLCPLFEKYVVDLVLSGSAHYYSHYIQNGISYMISGGGGAQRERPVTIETPRTITAVSTFHHLRISVNYPLMTIDGIDNSGSLFSSYGITAAAERTVPHSFSADGREALDEWMLFGTPDCDECRTFKETVFPRLKEKFADRPMRLAFYNVDKEANFNSYREIEAALGGTKHPFPALKIGSRLFSEQNLTYDYLDSAFTVMTIEQQSNKSGKRASGIPWITGAVVLLLGTAFLLFRKKALP